MAEPYARSRRFVAHPAGAYQTNVPSSLQRWVHEHATGLNRAAVASIVASVAIIIWVLPVRPLAILIQSGAERLGFWGFAVYAAAFLLMSIFSVPVWTMPLITLILLGVASARCHSHALIMCLWTNSCR